MKGYASPRAAASCKEMQQFFQSLLPAHFIGWIARDSNCHVATCMKNVSSSGFRHFYWIPLLSVAAPGRKECTPWGRPFWVDMRQFFERQFGGIWLVGCHVMRLCSDRVFPISRRWGFRLQIRLTWVPVAQPYSFTYMDFGNATMRIDRDEKLLVSSERVVWSSRAHRGRRMLKSLRTSDLRTGLWQISGFREAGNNTGNTWNVRIWDRKLRTF